MGRTDRRLSFDGGSIVKEPLLWVNRGKNTSS